MIDVSVPMTRRLLTKFLFEQLYVKGALKVSVSASISYKQLFFSNNTMFSTQNIRLYPCNPMHNNHIQKPPPPPPPHTHTHTHIHLDDMKAALGLSQAHKQSVSQHQIPNVGIVHERVVRMFYLHHNACLHTSSCGCASSNLDQYSNGEGQYSTDQLE